MRDDVMGGLVPKYCISNMPSPYTPQSVLRAMDLSGALLNYKGYEVIRSVESLSLTKSSSYLLPHHHQLKTMSKKVNQKADEIIPFYSSCKDYVDVMKFDYQKLLLFLIKIHGLENFQRKEG